MTTAPDLAAIAAQEARLVFPCFNLEIAWTLGVALREAAHGGGFPLTLEGLGCIGAITVSGLPQVEDHDLIVDALEGLLGA